MWLLESDEQIVRVDGVTHKLKKFDYQTDPMFAGLYDGVFDRFEQLSNHC